MGARLGRLGVPFVIALAGILVTAALAFSFAPDEDAAWLKPYCLELDPCECTWKSMVERRCSSTEAEVDRRKAAMNVVEKRMASYRGDLASMRTILWLQLSFLLFGIVVIIRERDETKSLEIPIVKIEVPLGWCHLIIPLALTYLYIVFGFLFDHLIQQRYILWEELAVMEAPRPGSSIHSLRMLLEDRWVMDSWFTEFHPTKIAMPVTSSSVVWFNRFLLVLFAAFIACQHVVSIFLLSRRAFPGKDKSAAFACVVLVLVIVVLGFSHFGFLVFGGNPNWFQWFVAAFTCLGLAGLTVKSPYGWGAFASEQLQTEEAERERNELAKAKAERSRETHRMATEAEQEAEVASKNATAAVNAAEAAAAAARAATAAAAAAREARDLAAAAEHSAAQLADERDD